jgi:hypothetical protein
MSSVKIQQRLISRSLHRGIDKELGIFQQLIAGVLYIETVLKSPSLRIFRLPLPQKIQDSKDPDSGSQAEHDKYHGMPF